MKKSKLIVLGTVFASGLMACNSNDEGEWITGSNGNNARDTVFHGNQYRYYGGGWYPLRNGLICPSYYSRPYSASEICNPGFAPAIPPSSFGGGGGVHGIHTGGFGSSSHVSVGG